jgi:glycerol kinase
MLEAICFQTREVLEAMALDLADERARATSRVEQGANADAVPAAASSGAAMLSALRVDGGATHNDLLMQLQADILQVPVQRPNFQETTALGAALAAGLGVGFWDEAFVLTPPADAGTTFAPAVPPGDADRRFGHWRKAVSRCLDLADLAN